MKRRSLALCLLESVLLVGCGGPSKARTVKLTPQAELSFWYSYSDDGPAGFLYIELRQRGQERQKTGTIVRSSGDIHDRAMEYLWYESKDKNVFGLYEPHDPTHIDALVDLRANRCYPVNPYNEREDIKRLIAILESDVGLDLRYLGANE